MISNAFAARSPEGELHLAKNQSDFAKKHNLNRLQINRALNKKLKSHKGWTFWFAEESEPAAPVDRAKEFIAISPDGTQYREKNINQFAMKHNLHQGHISECLQNKRKTYKGWRFTAC